MELGWDQIMALFILGLVVAVVTWIPTHEELFREPREWMLEKSQGNRPWWSRKFFFMWTCEFCLSHYVALAVVLIMDLRLLVEDWRGIVVALFATAAVANVFMSAFAKLRVGLSTDRVDLDLAKRVQSHDETEKASR